MLGICKRHPAEGVKRFMDIVFLAPVKDGGVAEAATLAEELNRVLLTADIRQVDSITERLQQMTDLGRGIMVPVRAWSEWINRIRIEQPNFRADCLLADSSAAMLADAARACGETRLGQMMDAAAILMLPQTGKDPEKEP